MATSRAQMWQLPLARAARPTRCRSAPSPTACIPRPGSPRRWPSSTTRYLGADWYAHLDDPDTLGAASTRSPTTSCGQAHRQLKSELIAYAPRARRRASARATARARRPLGAADALLDPNALTLGFARRFATYKRATLLFRDPERLARLLNNPDRPVQIIFAGKAHPADTARAGVHPPDLRVLAPARSSRARSSSSKTTTWTWRATWSAACDVWLNTPHPPARGQRHQRQEGQPQRRCPTAASSTAGGTKATTATTAGPSASAREYQDAETRDDADADALYTLLEREIVPLYYDRGSDEIPHNWVAVMKEAIKTVAPAFSMRRMVKEYVESLYLPALALGARIDADHYRLARELVEWEQRVRENWPDVSLQVEGPRDGQLQIGQPITLTALASLDGLTPDDVRVELIYGQDDDGAVRGRCVVAMERKGKAEHGVYRYHATIHPETTGSLVYGVRATPTHPGLASPYELGLAHWA